jgi:hypothetical protein
MRPQRAAVTKPSAISKAQSPGTAAHSAATCSIKVSAAAPPST